MSYHLIICLLIGTVILIRIIRFLTNHLTFLQIYKQALQFRGPKGLPLLGNALDFTGDTEDILKKIAESSKMYSSPYRMWIGPQLLIFIYNAEQIKKILHSDKAIAKSDLYRFYRGWLGNGLFTAPEEIWRIHRKLIGPTFNLKILESFVSVFAAKSQILVDKMENKVNGPEFEIFEGVSLCTLDIICETAMGITIEAQTKSDRTYIDAVQNAFATIYQRAFKIWLAPDVIFNRTELGKAHKTNLKTLHDFTENVIQKKMETFLDQNHPESTINETDDFDIPPKRKAYLDLLLESTHNKMKLSNLQLREEVDTMIVAGTDTSAQTISWIMLMLASFQDVQEKVYQELYEIYGNCDIAERNVTHEDLPRMEYMERVIKETLRLFPIAIAISRVIKADLNIGEHTLRKGTCVVLDILSVHRNKEYWTDPLKFDPDRFLPEEIAKRHSCCFLPFSIGPRNCIGSRFAMMEIKTILATILRRYCLKKNNAIPISEIRLKTESLMKPVIPITLRIERRLPKIE